MGRITVLDKHTAELIAAGEVVERPSSVVKELLENSIDAGAKNITVEIQHGGIDFLRITDDGHGILKEDVRNAFKRNATSKISVETDLERIGTLGFRGEALASISSVSKVQLITKAREEEIGSLYEIEGGVEKTFDDAGCPDGTTFIMRELFYNVPARYKFLKKDVSEGNAVSAVMDKIALSHPEISFTYIRDGRNLLKTSGDGKLLSAIYSVYGRDFANSLIPVDYELDGIKLNGYISRPTNGRANHNMQSTFINGRFVRSRTITVALEEAFKGSIMVGKFPSCVLNLEISPEAVDVNVHPSKLEVRFINERPVFDAVYHGVKSALLKNDSRKEAIIFNWGKTNVKHINPFNLANKVMEDKDKTSNTSIATNKQANKKSNSPIDELDILPDEGTKTINHSGHIPLKKDKVADSAVAKRNYFKFLDNIKEQDAQPDIDDKKIKPNIKEQDTKTVTTDPIKELDFVSDSEDNSIEENNTPVIDEDSSCDNDSTGEKSVEIIADENREHNDDKEFEIKTLIDEDKNTFRYIGEAMNTYIIVETDNNKIVLIDKHAAHERIIFEQLKKQKGKGTVQMLLVPITVTLEKNEYNSAIEHLDMFMEVGFQVENFGNGTVIVRSAPSYLKNCDIADTIVEICGYIADNKKDIMSKHMEWIYHNISCRSAIKAGNKSTEKELIDIAKQVFTNDDIRYCPHGRPVCIELSKYEIEKQFGRV